MHPLHLRQITLIYQEQYYNKEQYKVTTQHHHHTESIECQRYIRYQIIHILNISIAEISYIFFQRFGRYLRIFLVTCRLGITISCQCSNCCLPTLYLLFCGKCFGTVFQFISTLQQVCNTGYKCIHFSFSKQREHLWYLHPEQERSLSVIVCLLFRIQHTDCYQSGPLLPLVITFHCCQLHRLRLRHLITRPITGPCRKHSRNQTYPGSNLYA